VTMRPISTIELTDSRQTLKSIQTSVPNTCRNGKKLDTHTWDSHHQLHSALN